MTSILGEEEIFQASFDFEERLGPSFYEQVFVLIKVEEEVFEGEKAEESQVLFLELVEITLYFLVELM